jgi:hypothetical protein
VSDVPQDWIRERTSIEEIGADWSRRRKEYDWWTPPSPEWCREWEAFVDAIRDGDELYHFSQTTIVFPAEGYGDEGYVILRDGVQVRSVFWVSDTHSKTAEPSATADRPRA